MTLWMWPTLWLTAGIPASALPRDAAPWPTIPTGWEGPALGDDDSEKAARDAEKADREAERIAREEELYDNGTAALDEAQWDRAVEAFDRVVGGGGRRADAALYWKAYALHKRGQGPAALAVLEVLKKSHPQSRWLREAKALELEVRQGAGQAPRPEGEADEDLKLVALNTLLTTDPERAVPMLEKLLAGGSSSPRVRERALFVLCQTGSPRAREIVVRIARGQANAELQRKAIKFLGLFGGPESRQALSEIYASTSDIDVKRAILRGFMVGGEKARLVTAGRSETSPELRREAIRQLGVMGAQAELLEMYGAEGTGEVKHEILRALAMGGSADKLIEITRYEKDPALRGEAIRGLGLHGGEKTGPFLVSLYGEEKAPEARRQILRALFMQGNAQSLVEIARAEKDPALRKEAVSLLSHLNSKVGTDYLLEILNLNK
jgi:HEAT repeat protein